MLNHPKLIHLCSRNGALNVLDDDDYKDDDDCDDNDGSDDNVDSHTLITRQKEVIVPASDSR